MTTSPKAGEVTRLRVLAVIALLFLFAGLANVSWHSTSAATPEASSGAMPSLPPASQVDSSWYCAGATTAGGAAPGVLMLSNLGPRTSYGTITAVGTTGQPSVRHVSVPARSTLPVSESDLGAQGTNVGVTVELGGGQVAVSQTVAGAAGQAIAGCSSFTSPSWYFPAATTVQGDSLFMVLFNPSVTDVVADLSFYTDQGPTDPGDYQGVVLPAGRLVVLDIGQHVQDRKEVATTVKARRGRLVVEQFSWRTAAPAGLSLVLGSPSPASKWSFPYSATASGISQAFAFYNPTSEQAQVQARIDLKTGSAEPLRLSIPPQSEETVIANDEARIPPGVPYSLTAYSTNKVPFVAERVAMFAAPSATAGLAEMLGSLGTSTTWTLLPGYSDATSQKEIAFQNPGPRLISVSVEAVTGGSVHPVSGLQAVAVAPGDPVEVPLPPAYGSARPAYLVSASGPIVVEADASFANPSGADTRVGLPG